MRINILLLAFLLTSCTDESASYRALTSAGYSEIKFTGYSIFDCGEDDVFATGFVGKNPKGELVSGTVCCGAMTKGCTIRF